HRCAHPVIIGGTESLRFNQGHGYYRLCRSYRPDEDPPGLLSDKHTKCGVAHIVGHFEYTGYYWKMPTKTTDLINLLRKQSSVILGGQSLGESVRLIHDGRDQLAFALLQGHDLLLNGALRNHAVHHDLAGLANTVRTVNRLGFHCWVPPRVKQEAVVGLGKVQPETTSLQRDQEQRCFAFLELVDDLCAVAGVSIQVHELHAAFGQLVGQHLQV